MPGDNHTQTIQCAGCSAKLRIGASAIGKTVACPKCGQTIKVKGPSEPAKKLVVARPVSTPTAIDQNSGFGGQPLPAAPVNNWSDMQFPAANAPYQNYAPARAASGKTPPWVWVVVAGGASLFFVAVLGVVIVAMTLKSKTQPNGPPIASNQPIPMTPKPMTTTSPSTTTPATTTPSSANVPRSLSIGQTMPFQKLGPPRPFGKGISFHRVTISRVGKKPVSLNIFIPQGEHAPQSLPVMFEAPPGTNLLHGADINFPDEKTEILPFTEMGMITVTFELDGDMPEGLPPGSRMYVQFLQRAYKEFTEADAGVADGKLAIDYVLDQIPAADPKRLYAWGHSSAATVALLLASKDSRISKCIAMAPCTNLNERLGEVLTEPAMERQFPGLREYLTSGSPLTHVASLKCPVFIAHAEDDDNEPFRNTKAYADALKQAGGNVTFEALPRGGHYQAMLNVAIPKAVAWVK